MSRATDHELVAAYTDGIAELDPDERARVERLLRDDPAAAADADATRELIGKLRELPKVGNDPDWVKLEHQIRTAVGPVVPRPWWQRWQWLVPIGALAATAAAALLWMQRPAQESVVAHATPPVPVALPSAPPAPVPAPPTTMLWLDGEAIDVGDVEPSAVFDDLDQDVAPIASDGVSDSNDDSGILPATDLGWIDTLDDSAIDRAETWLARHPRQRKKS